MPKIKLCDNFLNPLYIAITFIFLIQFETLVLYPIAKITLIAKDNVDIPTLNYSLTNGFWGTLPCVLLGMGSTALIGLFIAIKYHKNQIKYLFSGNENYLK